MSQLENYLEQLRKVLDDYYLPTSQADRYFNEIEAGWQQIQVIRDQKLTYTQPEAIPPVADPLEELRTLARQIQQVVAELPKKIQEAKSQADKDKTTGGCLLVAAALLLCSGTVAVYHAGSGFIVVVFLGLLAFIFGRNIRDGSSSEVQNRADAEIIPVKEAIGISKLLRDQVYAEAKQALKKSRPTLPLELATAGWENEIWTNWEPVQSRVPLEAVRVGQIRVDDSGSPVLLVPLLGGRDLIFETSAGGRTQGGRGLIFETSAKGRTQAVQAIRGIMLRHLALLPPGRLRFTFIDPVGRGSNVAGFMQLGDYLPDLVSGKAWADPQHIERSLSELTERMDTLIQQYLRNKYESIEAYNEDAAVPEPYRLVVVYDFPQNFTEPAVRHLVSIAEHGPRCGIYPIVLYDPTKELPYGFSPDDLRHSCHIIEHHDGQLSWRDGVFAHFGIRLDTPPNEQQFDQIVAAIGEQAKRDSEIRVDYSQIAPSPSTWWKGDSRESVSVALGPAGAGKSQDFVLGEGTAHHALIAGRIGSGKGNLLDVIITSVSLKYSPEEVEFYLIDFKEGVDFKIYATNSLPHARVVAIESEREFGLSVLEGLDSEFERRGGLFRSHDVQNIVDYRNRTDEKLPRILLVVDEFQVFFREGDLLSQKVTTILDRLVRQGRAFGIHVVMASQTLVGTSSLPREIMDQMAIRIALQSSEADSRIILGEDNPAARLLSRPGEAIYNAQNGLIEGNKKFQVAYLPDKEGEQYLQRIQALAQKEEYQPPRAQIVFEGNAPAEINKNLQFMRLLEGTSEPVINKRLDAWIGEPISIKEPTSAYFRRQSGSNLIIVGRDEELALGMMSSALISLAAQSAPERARFYIIDFTSVDAKYGTLLSELGKLLPQTARYGRRSKLARFLGEIRDEVKSRLELDEEYESTLVEKPSVFLIIQGLHKARDLRSQESDSYDYGYDQEPANLLLTQQFAEILREGPEVGVYTLAWSDSLVNLNKRLVRSALSEFDMRVVMQMSANDSNHLIDSTAASQLGAFRAYFYSEEESTLEKFRPYSVPSAEWLRRYLHQ